MEKLRKKLYKKGWKDSEIKRTLKVMKKANETPKKKLFDHTLLWISLIALMATSTLVSLMLFPLMLILDSWKMIVALIFVGGAFGTVYSLVLHDISHLTRKHYTVFSLVVFAIVMVLSFFLTRVANLIDSIMNYKVVPNNWIVIGVVYSLVFILPYFVQDFIEFRKCC